MYLIALAENGTHKYGEPYKIFNHSIGDRIVDSLSSLVGSE
jgi:hypothetical protein